MRPISIVQVALPLVCVAVSGCANNANNATDPNQIKKDLEAVRSYFEKNHPGKTWDTGPASVDTEEVRAAYGGRRFYYVFSMPPVLPLLGIGDPTEVQQQEFREARAKFERERLSVTVGIDGDGKITPYQKPEDFNQGLMKVRNDLDVKVAAAAMLSLYVADEYGQHSVAVTEVAVQKDEQGWTCTVQRDKEFWGGWVSFNPKGRCPDMGRSYRGPYPP